MLDNPNECGIYPTSKCYQKLYDFVCEQKNKAKADQHKEIKKDLLKIAKRGEMEELRREVERYFEKL